MRRLHGLQEHISTECSQQYRGKDCDDNNVVHFEITFFDIHDHFSLAAMTIDRRHADHELIIQQRLFRYIRLLGSHCLSHLGDRINVLGGSCMIRQLFHRGSNLFFDKKSPILVGCVSEG
jgi:hypothetical protein